MRWSVPRETPIDCAAALWSAPSRSQSRRLSSSSTVRLTAPSAPSVENLRARVSQQTRRHFVIPAKSIASALSRI